jgi:hypothetical protein
MHNPLAEARDILASVWDDPTVLDKTKTTRGTAYPTALADGTFYVQYAFDGSASDADNREDAAVRFTVWASKNHPSDAIDFAGRLRPRVVAWSSASCWRVDRGIGRFADVDPRTGLPFCSFSARLQMRVDEPVAP